MNYNLLNGNGKKRSTMVRMYPETKLKLNDLRKELQAIQREDIKMPEILRRISNVPKLKDTLLQDALEKSRRKGGLRF